LSKAIRPIVGLDTNIVAWGLRDLANDEPKSVASKNLIANLDERNAIVVIPTVVLAEALVNIEDRYRAEFVAQISDSFMVAEFDAQASILAARLHDQHRDMIVQGEPGDRRAFKADTLIVASVKNSGAQEFFSDDSRCRNLAREAGMDGRGLPEFRENLFSRQ